MPGSNWNKFLFTYMIKLLSRGLVLCHGVSWLWKKPALPQVAGSLHISWCIDLICQFIWDSSNLLRASQNVRGSSVAVIRAYWPKVILGTKGLFHAMPLAHCLSLRGERVRTQCRNNGGMLLVVFLYDLYSTSFPPAYRLCCSQEV